jgi:DMSO/TMAO reductase YedYZ molybdopterin-dependent catalytic subunit
MVLQRTRPQLLETPFEVFDQGVFTPNDRSFARWYWAVIPTHFDTEAYRLTIRGAVTAPLSLSLAELMSFP